jgi:Carboxypeptidase regulatory-like domain
MLSCARVVHKTLRAVSRSHVIRAVFVLFLLLALPFLAHGQEATVVGTVTDPTGGVVPNVKITVTNAQTGVVHTITTNDVGQYVMPDLIVGKYNVKAEAPGFKAAETNGVVLNVNDRVRVDFQMKVGTTVETVSVEANTLAVQTDSSEQSSLVTGTQIAELATNGRTIYSYIVLTPGASNLDPDTQIPIPTGGASSNISFNGNRPGHNLFLLDGGENADRGGAGASSVLPSIDAISETQTLTSNYSADYGLSSGGTISSAIKSGTNTLHASAWEFFRNDALDARNFFNPAPQPVGELRYNIFGFNIGGPVTFGKLYNPDRKKTFFFYNMEWRKFIAGGSPIVQNVPATSEYGGDFGSTAINVPSTSLVTPAVLFRNCPGDANPSPATIVQGSPFPGNAIPSCMLDPNAQALLTAGGKYGGIFPAPTSGNQFIQPVSVPTNVKEEIVRIDHNFSDKFTIFGHFLAEQIANNQAKTMWSSDNVPSIGNTFGNPAYAAVVHTAYTISPTLVNEVAFNYNGNRIHILPEGLFTSPYTPVGFFTNAVNVDNRIPSINLANTGTNYTVNWTPWNNKADDYQIRDDVSWTKGRHQFKMGGSWALYKKVQDWFKNTEGGYSYNGQYTGNDFADYLLGLAQNYTQDALKEAGHWNNVSWAAYFQDNYRVNNRLTLNLGLRWDGIPHTYEASYQMANFFPNLYTSANQASLAPGGNTVLSTSPGLTTNSSLNSTFYTNGLSICGQNGTPRGCVNNAWQNWQPRLGFAYDLRGDGKTVIRGGYGVMNERIQGNDVYNNAGTPPLAASISFNNVVFNNPGQPTAGGTPSGSIPVNVVTGMDAANYKAPRSTQFSLGVQQALGKSVLSLAYVGTQNRHQNYYTEEDLAPIGDIPAYVNNTAAVPYNSVVQYLGYHDLKMAVDEANGDYNAFQASFRGQLPSSGLTYQFGYTFSHTNDATSNGSSAGDLGTISDPYAGWKYDFGPSAYDHHHILFVNFVYDVPLFKHSDNKAMKTMLGGWEVSGIVTAESGAPLNITMSGTNACNIVPNCSVRPNESGTPNNPHTQQEWFDTSVYTDPTCATGPDCWGNTPRNSVWGPGRDNWNVSLFKNFVLSESRGSNLQFRAEFFNLWNHTQWEADGVNNGVNVTANFACQTANQSPCTSGYVLNPSNHFGEITQAYDPRTIQLALKLYF